MTDPKLPVHVCSRYHVKASKSLWLACPVSLCRSHFSQRCGQVIRAGQHHRTNIRKGLIRRASEGKSTASQSVSRLQSAVD